MEEAEWVAVKGCTGRGKTRLLQILGGLDRPSAGTVNFDGQGLATLPETRLTEFRAASVGFIFQTFNLLPTLSAVENVQAALIPRRVRATARCPPAPQALEYVRLGDRGHRFP